MASLTAASSEASTLNESAMHDCAISIDSWFSDDRVPSLRDVERKSMMARASRFFVSEAYDNDHVSRRRCALAAVGRFQRTIFAAKVYGSGSIDLVIGSKPVFRADGEVTSSRATVR